MPRTAAAAAPTTPTKGADSTKWAPSSVLDSSPLNWVLLHILILTGAVLMAVYADSTFGFVICAVIFFSLLIATFGQLRYNASFNGFRMQILAASTMIFATIWQCNFAKPLPPQTSFSLGPFGNALLIGFSNLGLHLYEFHWATMTIFASGKMISSVVAPVWGIGKRNEVVLMGTCTLIGHACGYAIAINKRRLREEQASVVEMAAANRRADSRLNHVIKGLCGGANGLLDGLWLMAQQEGLAPSGHSQELFKQVVCRLSVPTVSRPGPSASVVPRARVHSLRAQLPDAEQHAQPPHVVAPEPYFLSTFSPHFGPPAVAPHTCCRRCGRCSTTRRSGVTGGRCLFRLNVAGASST